MTMKKIYIIPSLRTTAMAVETLIADSITSTSNVDGLGVGGGTSESSVNSGNVKGGSYNVWDDDWSE